VLSGRRGDLLDDGIVILRRRLLGGFMAQILQYVYRLPVITGHELSKSIALGYLALKSISRHVKDGAQSISSIYGSPIFWSQEDPEMMNLLFASFTGIEHWI
jgi:hypothetical protein